jgi:hypothetical protein
MKAKVLNKIVRETSGVHNYTLVPPILGRTKETIEIDPETHPLMKPYREQTNRNPVMCSFGHRPKSASRTFHPGTMKVRLTKGQIVQPAIAGKNGFGLPPSVLSKLLHAPKIRHPGEEEEETTEESSPHRKELIDPHNLFLANDSLFEGGNIGEMGLSSTHSRSHNDIDASRVAGGRGDILQKISKPKKTKKIHDEEWNGHFHVIEVPSNEKFDLKKSGIADTKLLPLKDRLTRCQVMCLIYNGIILHSIKV